ncbi:hypothetical protein [Peribacillus frigoritolerans]|uniref:hypothetical protein n=1 Tax=Peribacillus frigoritolerans TaxID=450367 RepID=UPI002022C289|nr:hypothetical protein [Peribacillus frigoritolerans]
MKHEWRKREKNLYIPKQEPELVSISGQKFFLLKGKGNPNEHEFAENIGVLYSLAYAVRMMPKQGYTPAGWIF